MVDGTCLLTGHRGKLVKAHLLPAALTKHSESGMHFIQAGEGQRPSKRWTSWYDPNLVTSEGEKILADYDDWGIKTLRDLNLVWSSWEGDLELKDEEADSLGRGIRVIDGVDGDRLRLFLLSLLWRAAASNLPEFAPIILRPGQLRRLATMLIDKDPSPRFLFPTCLIQLKTKGERHNATPISITKPRGSKGIPRRVRIFRFYVDGLIIHFHRDLDVRLWREIGGLAVGARPQFGVITIRR